jgi:hypothetical protein
VKCRYPVDHDAIASNLHSVEMMAQWPDDVRLSDIEPRFICSICGRALTQDRIPIGCCAMLRSDPLFSQKSAVIEL